MFDILCQQIYYITYLYIQLYYFMNISILVSIVFISERFLLIIQFFIFSYSAKQFFRIVHYPTLLTQCLCKNVSHETKRRRGKIKRRNLYHYDSVQLPHLPYYKVLVGKLPQIVAHIYQKAIFKHALGQVKSSEGMGCRLTVITAVKIIKYISIQSNIHNLFQDSF